MLKNNPFITISLLFMIEVMFVVYLDYIDRIPNGVQEILAVSLWFIIPVVAIVISISTINTTYKKSFRYFTIFIVIASVIGFIAMVYLTALAKAYQH